MTVSGSLATERGGAGSMKALLINVEKTMHDFQIFYFGLWFQAQHFGLFLDFFGYFKIVTEMLQTT